MPIPSLEQPLSWKSGDPDTIALLNDLQAHVLKHHGRRHALHLFLAFDPAKQSQIRAAIRQLSGHIKSAHQQLLEAEEFRASGKDAGTLRCFFLSHKGYSALGVPSPATDPSFTAGAKARADELNDDAVTTWEPHFQKEIHALLLLADNDTDRLAAERDSILASLAPAGVSLLGEERGDQLFNDRAEGIEHFGYVDGRSQPLYLTEDIRREQLLADGTSQWDPAAPPKRLLVTSGTGTGMKVEGSYFVFRKLEQDVKGFKEAEKRLADAMRLTGTDRERAGAVMVGRFEDGTPVVLRKTSGFGGPVPNNFNYDEDPQGTRCPFHAHIRKTNPRGSGGFGDPADEPRHLMARRGITFGARRPGLADQPESGVGLLFMAFQSNIVDQFEFTQMAWSNNVNFPKVPAGFAPPGLDPITGQGTAPAGSQQCPLQWGDPSTARVPGDFSGFVTMRGGEYFFAPVLSRLRSL